MIMFTTLYILFAAIQLLLAAYLLQPAFLLLVYSIKKLFFKQRKIIRSEGDKDFSFAVIVTAYKNLQLVPPLVDSVLKQTYRHFKVYVVADGCEQTDTGYNNDPQVKVLAPAVTLSAKIKSIDYAINNFDQEHDVLIILDADNLLHPDYLSVLNTYFNLGYRAVQTNMLAKNNDSVYAQLDAAGNYFSNFVDRRMRMELGLSANIWGLGIAMETTLYKEVVYNNFLGGFDKKIQADIVKLIPQLAYAEEAIVYDEKIDSGDALETQRTRWINAYFKYFKYGWNVFVTGLKRGSFNLMFFGFNLLRPPLFLQISGALFFAAFNLWIDPTLSISWIAALIIFPLSFLIIVAIMSTDKGVISSLLYLPLVFLRQVRAFLHIGKANKAFLQTPNNKVIYIEDLLKK
ncbi:Glycosyltransferase, catalytic subunit of cellulose synthase and poly-beta-1,6-N-acetylglucosamine synthase [Chitinophaga sp. CF118]|nr:Glycosyltransferase, catalytic subunit of cellulose synthase and poly-beta-1,6-N-acetylglucosamine synthase [Chitinophaga sp. CF118]